MKNDNNKPPINHQLLHEVLLENYHDQSIYTYSAIKIVKKNLELLNIRKSYSIFNEDL